LVEHLRTPDNLKQLRLTDDAPVNEDIETGRLVEIEGSSEYPVVRSIPRFVPEKNYTDSFKNQWSMFREDQVDSRSGATFSHELFFKVTGWKPEDLRDKWVLDAGCGAGRFAEVALESGAHVVAVDMSNSVEVCYETLHEKYPDRLHLVQADILALPFEPRSFDMVYCIGVLQHTPDPPEALRRVTEMVKPGGKLAVWIYELRLNTFFGIYAWKYALRPITKRLGYRFNQFFSFLLTLLLWPIWYPLSLLGSVGRAMLYLLPVAARSYARYDLGLKKKFRCVWLDTFDMYSPAYDSPQTAGRIRKILLEQGIYMVARNGPGAFSGTRPAGG
jgi:2-polyprenyl-3-methyl-5-hydroxy-6-metoxy-1,4-benzoquinol methylase